MQLFDVVLILRILLVQVQVYKKYIGKVDSVSYRNVRYIAEYLVEMVKRCQVKPKNM